MKTNLKFLGLTILAFAFIFVTASADRSAPLGSSETPTELAHEIVNLKTEMEMGLEIEARAPGASWLREGKEAPAVLISVDGVYNQDLLLWAGDETYSYRVSLGRLSKGRHRISVTLNPARSAAEARQAEVKAVHALPLAATNTAAEDRLAFAYSPVLYARANTIDHFTDIPLLTYYEILRPQTGDLIVRYTTIFTNEDGGTQTLALMARWGRGTDIEWVYEVRLRAGKVVAESFQGVNHETKPFTGSYTGGRHPLLAVASDNNNFSDLACSAVRFANLPVRADLENATRESVMDRYPQTYRVMTEELQREHRIDPQATGINVIADPRDYFYVEAASEQTGATLGFDVKVAGAKENFSSDLGDGRLRIDRSGNFRTAVRLPHGVAPASIESITARCHAGEHPASERSCKHLRLLRVLTLDENFLPHPLPLQSQGEVSLSPGQSQLYKVQH